MLTEFDLGHAYDFAIKRAILKKREYAVVAFGERCEVCELPMKEELPPAMRGGKIVTRIDAKGQAWWAA